MKKKIGTFKTLPIVQGDVNEHGSNEIIMQEGDGVILLHVFKSGEKKTYVVQNLDDYLITMRNTYKEGYEDNK